MRTYLSATIVTGLLFSVLLAGGCVPQSKYDELNAQCRNANAELAKTTEALTALRAQYQALQAEYDRLKAESDAKDAKIALLEKARADLLALVEKLKGQQTPVAVAPPSNFVLPPGLDEALKKLAEKYGWEYKNGMVKLSSDLTFDPGSDVVLEEAAAGLKQFAQIMSSEPEAAKYNVYVAGHTDDIPISKPETKRRHPTNWYLSAHRAVAVEDVIQNAGLAPVRLAAVGFGEYQPIVPNAAGHKGNKINRRVEIWILPPDRFLSVTGGTVADDAAPVAAPKTPAAAADKPAAPAAE
jgi:chemotaxis protein MotB